MNRDAQKRNLSGLIVTALIVLGLMVAGPVEAVKLNIASDKGVYSGDDDEVTFRVAVDIQKNEMVPIKSLKLRINDDFKVCDFMPDGSNSCPNVEIALVEPSAESVGDLKGTGFGFSGSEEPGGKQTDFGFGYGFDEQPRRAGFKGELVYEIKWGIAADGVPNGKYSAGLEAFAENDGTEFTYISRFPEYFNININPPTEEEFHRAIVTANGGEVNSINGMGNFSLENQKFFSELRSKGKIEGNAVLNIYAEKPDTTKVTMQLKMKNFDADEFDAGGIDITGDADVEFHKTKIGVWSNGARTGFEAPERILGTLKDVHLVVEDGTVSIISSDPKLPFDVELDVAEFSFV